MRRTNMLLTRHIQERMAQRGYNVQMLEIILSCNNIDYEHDRYYLNQISKIELRNELTDSLKKLISLKQQLSHLKKIRTKLLASSIQTQN